MAMFEVCQGAKAVPLDLIYPVRMGKRPRRTANWHRLKIRQPAFQSATGRGNTCTFGLLNGSFSPTNEFTCDIHPSQSGHMLIGKVVAQTFAGAKSER